jgi:RNA polymerase sigma-70 factor, ECF subfamily
MTSNAELHACEQETHDLTQLQAEFESMVRDCRHRLVKLASRYCQPRDVAEDAVQAALLKAWAALPGFRRDAKLFTWLTTIVVNEALQILRKQKRKPTVELDYEHESYLLTPEMQRKQHHSPEVRLLIEERNTHLMKALQRLPGPMRHALTLNALEEIPIRQAAQRLEISAASAKTRVFRGKRELKRRWAADRQTLYCA